MSYFIRIFTVVIFSILVVFTILFFWASSSKRNVNDYAGVTFYNYKIKSVKNDTMSIITYNIGYLSGMTNNQPVKPDIGLFSGNLSKAIKLINAYHPTFIGLQEIDFSARRSFYFNQMDTIAEKANFLSAGYVVNWDKRYVPFPYWPIQVHFGEIVSGQAVLSKYPLLSNRRIVLPKPQNNPFYYNAFYLDRLIQIVEVDLENQILIIINVHLDAYDSETREEQSEILLEVIKKYFYDFPLLLIGDFNTEPPFTMGNEYGEKTIQNILSLPGIHMSIKESDYKLRPEDYFTFSSRDPHEKIDYIFYNDKILPVESFVIRSAGEISDHLPIFFKFIIKND